MLRHLAATLAISLLALSAPAVAAQQLPADFEAFAQQLEGMMADLLGRSDIQPVYNAHPNGLYSMTVPLTERDRERFLASGAVAGPQTTLANGHQASTPGSPATLVHAVVSSLDVDYNFWFVVVNLGSQDVNRRTVNTVRGPGLNFKRVDTLIYPENAIETYWFELQDVFEDAGIFTFKTKVSRAGATKGKSFAQ